jgi:hypothetical protein
MKNVSDVEWPSCWVRVTLPFGIEVMSQGVVPECREDVVWLVSELSRLGSGDGCVVERYRPWGKEAR